MKRKFARRLLKLWSILASAPPMLYRLGRKRLGLPCPPRLHYVVPGADWVTDWVGHYITAGITAQFGWPAHVTVAPHLLVGHIVHYGEPGTFLASSGTRCNHHNAIVATLFHGSLAVEFPELKKRTESFIGNMQILARIVTACSIMEERLVAWGASPDRVVRIPLGVDLALFRPPSEQERTELRRKTGIPDDAFCIGSFEKDGVGWEEGLTPKLVKGPDVFLEAIKRLHEQYNLFVLLTAPARGYVKQGLESLGVSYRHEIRSDYRDVADCYRCLDLYLVTSREEGGPQAVLESLASGVPLVSTRVGLAPDVVQHGQDGLLADPEDVDTLAEYVARLIEQPNLRRRLIQNGLKTITAYDWRQISAKYYRELYLPLLGGCTHENLRAEAWRQEAGTAR
jgi:glycosyltransferase involved in cell wall biosynthesis